MLVFASITFLFRCDERTGDTERDSERIILRPLLASTEPVHWNWVCIVKSTCAHCIVEWQAKQINASTKRRELKIQCAISGSDAPSFLLQCNRRRRKKWRREEKKAQKRKRNRKIVHSSSGLFADKGVSMHAVQKLIAAIHCHLPLSFTSFLFVWV